MDLITVSQSAELLGVTPGRVRQLVYAGRLPAQRINARLLLIRRSDLELVRDRRPGRPWPGKPAKKPKRNKSQVSK